MRVLGNGQGSALTESWNHWRDLNRPLYHAVLARFRHVPLVRTYEFDTWGELMDVMAANGVTVTTRGVVACEGECSFHLLEWEGQVVGYASNPSEEERETILLEYGIDPKYRTTLDARLPIFTDD